MTESYFITFNRDQPDGLFWKETDYHKQKEIELRNPVFKRNKAKQRNTICKKMRK